MKTTTLTPLALASLLLISATAQAQAQVQAQAQAQAAVASAETASAPAPAGAMQTVIISASADASADGLTQPYAGGQVARGGRLGLLGNVDMMDTPFNTTNYTHELIQDQQAKSVADVLQNDPSVRVARGFGNYQELYVIRGFAVNSDDLAYNGLYGLLPRQYVAAELLERVEVFRGANSFLNGAAPGGGGIGGAINLLPKRASATPLTQLTAGIETGGQGYGALDIGRRFGPDNNTGIRVNAVRRDGDTGVDGEQRALSVLSVGFDYDGGNFRLSADVGHQDHQLKGARPSVTLAPDIAMPGAPDASSNFGQPWTRSNERNTFGTVRGEIDLATDVVAWAAFGARSGDESNILALPTVSNSDGTADMYRFDNVRRDNVRSGEIGVRGKLQTGDVKHTLSATASTFRLESRNAFGYSANFTTNIYRPTDVTMPENIDIEGAGGNMNDPLLTAKNTLTSVAVADTLSMFNDTVLLTLGARRQTIKSDSFDYNTGASLSRYDESRVTPVAAIVYKPVQGVSLYANYIEGLQQGPVAPNINISNRGESFAPFVSRQKEIGIKVDAGKVGFSAALFSTTLPSAYVQDGRFGVFGEQRNEGLELSVFGAPLRGVRVLGGLTLLDAKQRTTLGAVNQGNDVIGVPDTQLNLGAEWDVPALRGLTLTARTLYTATQYADGANTQQLPSWTRVDLGASYATRIADKDVTLRARIDNVADKNYWASAGGYPGSGYLVLGAPRTVVVSATVAF